MDRRSFLTLLGSGAVSATLSNFAPSTAYGSSTRIIRELPKSDVKQLAWTVDDGTSIESVKRYIRLVAENDLRITFFVYSAMGSWLANKKELQPLVDNGQIQLANHSAHHPALTTLSTKGIQKELKGAHNFIERNFGVDARPFYRPPYGSINAKVVEAAADIGYTKPMLWSGSLGDASNIRASRILTLAKESFYDRSIVLAHANNLTSAQVFKPMLKLISDRELNLVTLNDVYGANE
jgi:peptidoglycan/xylan/chitin deacetylase (PgdA/CDA1 family)